MNKAHTGVLLVNLGTPDSPSVPDVRKYLFQFLNDPRVIDINPLARLLLVNLIIVPFRAPKSAKIYKELWEEKGSPLLYNGVALTELVQNSLGPEYKVVLGMRYQSPSLEGAVKSLLNKDLKKIIVLPLFPQYASASTGSVHQEMMRLIHKEEIIPQVNFISNYFDHPLFIKSFSELAKKHLEKDTYDQVLFTYHGLPERQIKKGDCTGTCLVQENCCETMHESKRFCYRAQCFETTRLIVKELGLKEGTYMTSFQSRLGRDPWIKPYSDYVIADLPKHGKKKVLALVPSFVSDCLETTIEVGEEYRELFMKNGGEKWQMVESLNLSTIWVETIKDLILNN
jgi:ferrochelatase